MDEIEASRRRYRRSEAWREVARLGKKGERYPLILVDSHGWCMRLGPRDREDERYYSSLPSLLKGLHEHLVRRKDHESARGVTEMKDLLARNLQEARELGRELERLWREVRLRRDSGIITVKGWCSRLQDRCAPCAKVALYFDAKGAGSQGSPPGVSGKLNDLDSW